MAIFTCLSPLSLTAVTLNTGENGSDAQPVIFSGAVAVCTVASL